MITSLHVANSTSHLWAFPSPISTVGLFAILVSFANIVSKALVTSDALAPVPPSYDALLSKSGSATVEGVHPSILTSFASSTWLLRRL